MFIRALCVLGIKAKDGRSPIYPGSVSEVDDADGLRMIEAGCAVEVGAVATERPSNISPTRSLSENPPEIGNARNEPSEGKNGDLEDMTYTELKAMAKEMGIETGKLKSKSSMIEAIESAMRAAPTEDDLPDLAPQDVVDA